MIDTFGTGRVDEQTLISAVNKHFDLRPAGIIRELNLRRPIYKDIAAYGHFGRSNLDLTWERTDKAADLRQEVGLSRGLAPLISHL